MREIDFSTSRPILDIYRHSLLNSVSLPNFTRQAELFILFNQEYFKSKSFHLKQGIILVKTLYCVEFHLSNVSVITFVVVTIYFLQFLSHTTTIQKNNQLIS